MARSLDVEKASTEQSICLQKRKHRTFSERKRRSQRRKRVFRAQAWLPKAEARLPSSCIPHKGKNVYPSENVHRKGGNTSYGEKATQAKAKKSLPSENTFTERKRVPRAKTWLAKFQTRLSSENVPRKGEKAFTERKRLSQRRKGFCLKKVMFAKAKMCIKHDNRAKTPLPSEEVLRKGKNAFNERKCGSQS